MSVTKFDGGLPLAAFSGGTDSCSDTSNIPPDYLGAAVYHLEANEGFCVPLDDEGRIVFSSSEVRFCPSFLRLSWLIV